jgi:hypothetical protein
MSSYQCHSSCLALLAIPCLICPQGVVYITDETSRREITSWRLDSAPEVAPAVIGGPGSAHFVMVVDMSGSMRKSDVQGFNTRAEAVYTCLARDLVEPQLRMGAHGVKVRCCLMHVSRVKGGQEGSHTSDFVTLARQRVVCS